jgi:hypothetical protein
MDDLVLARDPPEALTFDAETGAEQRAVMLPAHRAVTVGEPRKRRRDLEGHGRAEAGAARRIAHPHRTAPAGAADAPERTRADRSSRAATVAATASALIEIAPEGGCKRSGFSVRRSRTVKA